MQKVSCREQFTGTRRGIPHLSKTKWQINTIQVHVNRAGGPKIYSNTHLTRQETTTVCVSQRFPANSQPHCGNFLSNYCSNRKRCIMLLFQSTTHQRKTFFTEDILHRKQDGVFLFIKTTEMGVSSWEFLSWKSVFYVMLHLSLETYDLYKQHLQSSEKDSLR